MMTYIQEKEINKRLIEEVVMVKLFDNPWPRGLSRERAAKYIGVSTTLFDEMVRKKEMPQPRQASRGRVIWDMEDLNHAFENLPYRGEVEENEWAKK